MSLEKFIKLTRQLYPTGRAFRIKLESWKAKLHEGLAISEAQAHADAHSILYSILPDNANFTALDAAQWEQRLGLITNEAVPLADRKLAIYRKINHPGTIPARQHYLYLEGQLRAAGFDVYVHENRFDDGMGGWETRTPEEVTGGPAPIVVQHGNPPQHGDVQSGSGTWNLIANNLDETLDSSFNVGGNFRSTFFIGGPYAGEFADVDANRKLEFRQLVLRIKPVQTIAYLFINYI